MKYSFHCLHSRLIKLYPSTNIVNIYGFMDLKLQFYSILPYIGTQLINFSLYMYGLNHFYNTRTLPSLLQLVNVPIIMLICYWIWQKPKMTDTIVCRETYGSHSEGRYVRQWDGSIVRTQYNKDAQFVGFKTFLRVSYCHYINGPFCDAQPHPSPFFFKKVEIFTSVKVFRLHLGM